MGTWTSLRPLMINALVTQCSCSTLSSVKTETCFLKVTLGDNLMSNNNAEQLFKALHSWKPEVNYKRHGQRIGHTSVKGRGGTRCLFWFSFFFFFFFFFFFVFFFLFRRTLTELSTRFSIKNHTDQKKGKERQRGTFQAVDSVFDGTLWWVVSGKTLRIISSWMSSQGNSIGLRAERGWDGPGLLVDVFC